MSLTKSLAQLSLGKRELDFGNRSQKAQMVNSEFGELRLSAVTEICGTLLQLAHMHHVSTQNA